MRWHAVWVLSFVLASAVQAQEEYATYFDPQYGYAIRYPATLLKPIPGNEGEGRAFTAIEGHAGFRVFAKPAQASPHSIADEVQNVCPGQRPSYRVAKPGLVAISCQVDDHIIYQKTLLRHGLELTVRGEYPVRERRTWDPVVVSIAQSMTIDVDR